LRGDSHKDGIVVAKEGKGSGESEFVYRNAGKTVNIDITR
jgi:hypothetical protein